VSGAGSKWNVSDSLYLGLFDGTGILNIDDGGLVSVTGQLWTNYGSQNSLEDSFINITTGGQLALRGDAADSLVEFLDFVVNSVRFWDDSLNAWAPITTATRDVDYKLEYLTDGDLAGYTLLTVGDVTLPTLAGDYNDDGVVDAADYTVWRDNLSSLVLLPNETASEGFVNQADYDVWRANFGAVATPAAVNLAGGAIPEPRSLIATMLAAAILAVVCRHSEFGFWARYSRWTAKY
jgi:T5SS/PEP-CTERM-associated repeat protein